MTEASYNPITSKYQVAGLGLFHQLAPLLVVLAAGEMDFGTVSSPAGAAHGQSSGSSLGQEASVSASVCQRASGDNDATCVRWVG